MRYLLPLALTACAHRPAPAGLEPVALAAALDLAAMVVEVEAATAGPVGCVVAPVVGAAARTAAAFARGGGVLAGVTVDPTSCGVTASSVDLPAWLPVAVASVVGMVPASAPCGLRAAVQYVSGAGVAVASWATDTTQPIVVPSVEVCGEQ
jgi:hypothetical protein